MTDRPLTIAFHIGAHKTATSHMQRSLKQARRALSAHGVRYFGPTHFRHPGHSIQALFGLHQTQHTDATSQATAQLAAMANGGHRLVFSEENYIGPLNQPQGRTMAQRYKSAGSRLTALSRAIGRPIDVFLAIRRPTAFINSAYGQMLLGGRVQPVSVFQKRNPLSSVDWVGLVTRLRASEGVGQLTVWQYEHYPAVFDQIMRLMVGDAAAPVVMPRPRYINRGLSAAAVAQVLAQDDAETDARSAAAARKALPVEDGHAPFDGFAAEEHAIGDAVYARQISTIAAMERVTLLRPVVS